MTPERSEDLPAALHAATALPVERSGTGRGPALVAPDPRAGRRVLEFFTAHIRNPHTRKAYARAAAGFAAWCGAHAIGHPRAYSGASHPAIPRESIQRFRPEAIQFLGAGRNGG